VSPPPGRGSWRDRLESFLSARLTDDTTATLRAMNADDTAPTRAGLPDLERLLREATAKRAIVRAWLDGLHDQHPAGAARRPPVPDAVIAELAVVYCDHPEFRPEWMQPGPADRPAIPPPLPHPAATTAPAGHAATVLEFVRTRRDEPRR
jgi:hypothetical protein